MVTGHITHVLAKFTQRCYSASLVVMRHRNSKPIKLANRTAKAQLNTTRSSVTITSSY